MNPKPEVNIRPTGETDLDFVVSAENDPANRDYIFQWPLAKHRASLTDPEYRHLLVESENGPAGYAILAGRNSPHQSLELMRLVITEKGRGIGRAALEQIKQQSFTEWGANRLWLDVIEHNHRAQHLYRSVGFQVEGTLREAYFRDGQYLTVMVMSILRREFIP